jgi:hypothetical protein
LRYERLKFTFDTLEYPATDTLIHELAIYSQNKKTIY